MKEYQKCECEEHLGLIDTPKDAPKYIRCPSCNRRLKPRLKNCHYPYPDEECWHMYIPPHKKKKWWKIKKGS